MLLITTVRGFTKHAGVASTEKLAAGLCNSPCYVSIEEENLDSGCENPLLEFERDIEREKE